MICIAYTAIITYQLIKTLNLHRKGETRRNPAYIIRSIYIQFTILILLTCILLAIQQYPWTSFLLLLYLLYLFIVLLIYMDIKERGLLIDINLLLGATITLDMALELIFMPPEKQICRNILIAMTIILVVAIAIVLTIKIKKIKKA